MYKLLLLPLLALPLIACGHYECPVKKVKVEKDSISAGGRASFGGFRGGTSFRGGSSFRTTPPLSSFSSKSYMKPSDTNHNILVPALIAASVLHYNSDKDDNDEYKCPVEEVWIED